MTRRSRMNWALAGLSLALCLAAVVALSAQGGGRPPGGGGGGGGGGMAASQTRLAVVTAALKLDDTQKKQVKTILDDAFKAAAPVRTSLTAARQKLGAAVQAGDQAQIDQATSAYAEQATAMARAEAQAVAKIASGLKPDQATPAAVQTTVSLMRGAFVGKKWDTTPDVRFY
jgi:hypothetical protein